MKNYLKFEFKNTIFIMILGTLLHFTYKWSNYNVFISLFSSVNESVWEHLKILFFPSLITIIFGTICLKDEFPNYLCIKTKGLLLAMVFIVTFFYVYKGILGFNVSLFNIGSFYVAILIEQIYTYKSKQSLCNYKLLSLIILIILTLAFIVFTFYPPELGIFASV